jgi:hypothetical protein
MVGVRMPTALSLKQALAKRSFQPNAVAMDYRYLIA